MLGEQTRAKLAADLAEAERSRVPIDPLTAAYPDIDVVDAYQIQLINIRSRVAEGARVVGHKVGLSSEAMQKMMGVGEPDYGHLLAEMQVFEDVPVASSRFCTRGWRSRWVSSWLMICPGGAPRMTCWRRRLRLRRRSS